MKNSLKLSWTDVECMLHNIIREMHREQWSPDLIVGVDRGGLPISVMLSHYLGVKHENLKVSLRGEDGEDCESNLWLPELAVEEGKQLLIVDDINDTGATQAWIKDDWSKSVSGSSPDFLEKHWHTNIRWASLVTNDASKETTDYYGMSINKLESNVWIDFPWESWWGRRTT